MVELEDYSYRLMRIDCTPGYTDFEIVAHGDKVTYASPNDGPEISLRLRSTGNDAIPLRPQGTIAAPFQRLYLSVGATPKTIYLLVSSPDLSLESRDVNVNNISSVSNVGNINSINSLALVSALTSITNPVTCKDYNLERALNAKAFESSVTVPASPGNYSLAQVFNPVASGKTIIVRECTFDTNSPSSSTQDFQFRLYNTPLSAIERTFLCLHRGTADSVCELRYQSAGELYGTLGKRVALQAATNTPYRIGNINIVLPPGTGLVLGTNTVNAFMRVTITIIEV